MSEGRLRIIPLGGLGEIGLNFMLIEYCPAEGGRPTAIAVDCGLMFPEQEMLGIDVVIPDFGYLHQHSHLQAVIFTHGHEDHIGGLPYLLQDFNVPVYGTPFTLGLIRDRLAERGLLEQTTLHEFRPRQEWQIGPFRIEGIPVTHSIVDASALAITTPLGTIIHSGDFKIDHTPVDDQQTDLARLAEWGERGVLILLADSTNVERPGSNPSERSLTRPLEHIIAQSQGKVLVATFASHIHRIRQILDLSLKQGRAVGVVGRRLVSNIGIAQDTGHLSLGPDVLLDVGQVARRAPQTVTLLTTGSQGEPMSALSRIAVGTHPQVQLAAGDTVVLSSRVIPGNERTIARLLDHLSRRGADIYYEAISCVHVSGHACQDELRLMLNLVRPRYFVPIHGEYRHLVRHSALARQVGIGPDEVFLLENGQVLELDRHGAFQTDSVQAGRVFVDGLAGIEEELLRDRRHMASDGIIVAILSIDQQTGELISGPELLSRGFLANTNGEGLRKAKEVVRNALGERPPESRTDIGTVKEQVRLSLRRYFRRTLGRRPVVLAFVTEM